MSSFRSTLCRVICCRWARRDETRRDKTRRAPPPHFYLKLTAFLGDTAVGLGHCAHNSSAPRPVLRFLFLEHSYLPGLVCREACLTRDSDAAFSSSRERPSIRRPGKRFAGPARRSEPCCVYCTAQHCTTTEIESTIACACAALIRSRVGILQYRFRAGRSVLSYCLVRFF